jgi:hypothetical protein
MAENFTVMEREQHQIQEEKRSPIEFHIQSKERFTVTHNNQTNTNKTQRKNPKRAKFNLS